MTEIGHSETEHAVDILTTMPAGLIAMGVFILLGLITWSFRDVANRHDHKTNDSKGHH